MVSTNLGWVIVFLVLLNIGILGNSSLLCFYTFTLITGQNLRPTDQILNQLVLANCLVLFSKGIPQQMAALGFKYFLDSAGCKLLFYVHRVSRGVSLTTTSLLGGFQAFKLCPRFSVWMKLRIRIPKYIDFFSSLCWMLNLLVNIHVAVKVEGPKNSKNVSLEKIYKYCSMPTTDRLTSSLLPSTILLIDYMFIGLMVWASGSMVLVLHRHKQQLQYIHSESLSSRPSHEARATRTILILVSMFVLFYSLSSILTLCIALRLSPAQWLVDTSVFMSLCFPTLSPFVLITSDTRISKLYFACWAR